jgi:capsule biosynthesis phosphatase
MIVIVLCGGLETQLEDYSFPKPLNMIYGKPAISFCLEKLPESVDTIHFVVAPHLIKYNFAEIVINEFKTKKCIFHYLPYFTRGAIESAFIGTNDISENDEENVIFLDNDILYNFPENLFTNRQDPFIGYSIDKTNNDKYSFIKKDENNNITEFKEKRRISDLFCCGVYGFVNLKQFRSLALNRIYSNNSTELYMSLLFQNMLEQNIIIKGVFFEGTINHIGSLKELKQSWVSIQKPKMRICFDLDNTLVTYPSIPNDYSTVKPIFSMINLAKKLHSEGHTIIIYTARRMKTHKNNIGAVIKDIGAITFKTLEDLDIPYDEIIFGKPIADMYIDDRAINPYRNNLSSMGYIYTLESELPLNSLNPNKYNSIQVVDNKIIKKGPKEFLQGEIYYYKNIPQHNTLYNYFPKYYSSYFEDETGILNIEYIKGIPVFTIYKNNLLTINNIFTCLEFLDLLHNYQEDTSLISIDSVISNYIDKLEQRFSIKSDYPFEDAETIQQICLSKLKKYILNNKIKIVKYIHGDFWFSNMIIDFSNKLKIFDMRGRVSNILTTNGDRLYDYAKFYQSILGYDCILNNISLPNNYQILKTYFENEILKNGICLDDLISVTFSLVIGTLPFIEKNDTKQRVWNWIKEIFV